MKNSFQNFERVLHGNEIVQCLQGYKRHEFNQVTSKWKTLKQPVYLLKAVEFCSTCDIQIDITLAIFWENLRNHTF